MVVPDAGAAADQAMPGQALCYVTGDAASAASAIGHAIDNLPAMRAAAALSAPDVRPMDRHFDELFARYAEIVSMRRRAA
jgi:hypothetical protein